MDSAGAPPAAADEPKDPVRLKVSNLEPHVTREQVESHFAAYGRVVDVYRQAPGEEAPGQAYVKFASAEVATRAASISHVMNGRELVVERAELLESEEEGWRIYVVCSKYVQEMQLRSFFETHGAEEPNATAEVIHTKVLRDNRGNSRGCAFVTFRERPCAERAVARCNGMDLKGRVLKVMMADRRRASEGEADGAPAAAVAAAAAASPATAGAAPAGALARPTAQQSGESTAAPRPRPALPLELAEGGDSPHMAALEGLLDGAGASAEASADALRLAAEASEQLREAGTERAARQLCAVEALMRCLDAAASDISGVAARGALVGARRAARSALERAIDVELAAVDARLSELGATATAAAASAAAPALAATASSSAAAGLSEADEEVRAAAREHARAAEAYARHICAQLSQSAAEGGGGAGVAGSGGAATDDARRRRRAALREAARHAAVLVAAQWSEPTEVATALADTRQASKEAMSLALAPGVYGDGDGDGDGDEATTPPQPPIELGGCTARPLPQKQAAMDQLLRSHAQQVADAQRQLAYRRAQLALPPSSSPPPQTSASQSGLPACARAGDASAPPPEAGHGQPPLAPTAIEARGADEGRIVGPWPPLLIAGARTAVGVAPSTPSGVSGGVALWGF